jgi:hypothetical protein
VQRRVIKRINLCQISTSNKNPRARGGKHKPRATIKRNLRTCSTDRTDQPRIKHHYAATRFRWIWLKPKRDNAVGVTIDSEGCGHLGQSTENQV